MTATALLGIVLCASGMSPTEALASSQAEDSGSEILIVPRTKGPALDAGESPFPIVARSAQPALADDSGILIVPRPPRPRTSSETSGGPSLVPDASEPQATPAAPTGGTTLRPRNVSITQRSWGRGYYPTPYRTFYGRYGVRFNLWWRRVPLFYHPFQFSYPPYYPQWSLPYPY